jgi:PAS domain-containing protein
LGKSAGAVDARFAAGGAGRWVGHLLATTREAADHQRAQVTLRHKRDHNRSGCVGAALPRLFEAAHEGILIVDPESREIIDVNPFLVEFLG